MYDILKLGKIGQRVQIQNLNFTSPITGGAIPQTINGTIFLEISSSGVTRGAVAQFSEQQPTITSTSNPVVDYQLVLHIDIKIPPGADAVTKLAEYLFHEGIHMLLHFDREMNSLFGSNAPGQSGTLALFDSYMQWAKQSRHYVNMRGQMVGAILIFFNARQVQHLAPEDIADTVIKRVIEEMFAVDLQIEKFPGTTATSNPTVIVQAYLDEYLEQEGVLLNGNLSSNRTQIMTAMQFVLEDIQRSRTAPNP
jgi:hypothetical protein